MLSSISTKLKSPKPKSLLLFLLHHSPYHHYSKIHSDLSKLARSLPQTLTLTKSPSLPRMPSPLLPISSSPSSSSSSSSSSLSLQQKPLNRSLFSSLREDGEEERKKPLLNGEGSERRRGSDVEAGDGEMSTEEAIDRNVGHAAAETYLVTRLGLILLKYLGLGYRWIMRFAALGLYAILLMPGFLQVGYYYYTSKQIKRSIVYGDQPRNRLDLYLPVDSDGPKPVVAFVTGGAWIIGYKAWGTALGLQLAEKDIIVACIDYRNFPQATISDMVNDASQGISFVCNNIAEYGGDPNRVYVMGQSAGAHISSCALVEKAIQECGEGETSSWSVSQIKAYFGLSGGYNLPKLVDHFHGRGLYRSIFLSIMEGDQSLGRFSPEVLVQDPNFKSAVPLLPPFILYHGTADYSIPSDSSKEFVEALQRVGAQAELVLYEGKTHTDLFVQDSLRGGTDKLVCDIVSYVHAGDEAALAKDARTPPRRRLVPECMLKLARKISPF